MWGGKGKCTLGRGLGSSPRKMLLCLCPSTSVHQFVLAGKNILYICHYFNLQLENIWRGKPECLREKPFPHPHPSRLNPVIWVVGYIAYHLNEVSSPTLCNLASC